jgi:hypothetical protein
MSHGRNRGCERAAPFLLISRKINFTSMRASPLSPTPQTAVSIHVSPGQSQSLGVSQNKKILVEHFMGGGNVKPEQNDDKPPLAFATLKLAPVEIWTRIVQYTVASHCPNLQRVNQQLKNLSLVSKPLRGIVQAEPNYQFKYILSILTKMAEDLVKMGSSSVIPPKRRGS